MPAPTDRPTGAPCWIDLMTSDAAGAQEFYSSLFGWTATKSDEEKYGGYITFSLDGRDVAGCMAKDADNPVPDTWSVYLKTADARATAAAAAEHGGSVFVEPMEVPEMGVMAFVGDPGGAGVGLWQAAPFEGFEVVDEPNAPAWFELHSRSYAADVAFYRDVLGWDTHVMSDTPEFRYTTLGADPQAAAGIMDASGVRGETPPAWSVYFRVEDCTAACARAAELGGSVVDAPVDSPYGRLATVADPTGAVLTLIGPAAG